MSTGTIQQVVENLRVEVERNRSVDSSAVALLTQLAARIEELKNDPAALQQFADEIRDSTDALRQAVTTNTPASEGG